jgi:hypothetical protein
MEKHQTTKTYKEIDWLVNHKDFLNIHKIEKKLNMPEATLKKFVQGQRGLALKWHDPVHDWVKQFKKA